MKGEKITLGGIPVTVISDEDTEKVDYVVCLPVGPSPFDDNLTGVCSHCGIKIMFRPYMPKTPPKICIHCAAKLPKGNVQ